MKTYIHFANPVKAIGGGKSLTFNGLKRHSRPFLSLRLIVFALCLLGTACLFVSCEKPDFGFEDDETRSKNGNDSTSTVTISISGPEWGGTEYYEY